MINRLQMLGLSTVWVCMLAATGFAQQDEAALPPDTETEETEPEAPAGKEVEINEDNYRQFMELKDPLQQRTILPENSYQSQAGLQKLDKLPEESQKHLRNQLREIIVQGDPWQPGDEDGEYPYVPSEAARTDGELQKQEAEAWGELVDHYHARESDIYANASRTSAAAAAGGMLGDGSQSGNESTGGSKGQNGDGEQAGQQSQSGQSSTGQSITSQSNAGGGYSPNAANEPGENSTQGVSQNAMEFLMKSGKLGANAGSNTNSSPGGNEGQAGTQQKSAQQQATQQQAQSAQMQTAQGQAGQEQSEQAQTAQNQAGQEQSSQDQVARQTDSEQAQTLSDTAAQIPADQTSEESTEGTSQNALEYLMGQGAQNEDDAGDTLTIEDLVNAQGVSVQIDAGGNNSEEEPDEKPTKKDGGG